MGLNALFTLNVTGGDSANGDTNQSADDCHFHFVLSLVFHLRTNFKQFRKNNNMDN
jgi:hypothetical protein